MGRVDLVPNNAPELTHANVRHAIRHPPIARYLKGAAVEQDMAVSAKAEHVRRMVGPVMRTAQRTDVSGLRVWPSRGV